MADEKAKPAERDGGADSVVSEARVRFQRAKEALSDNRALAVEDTKFVLGDSDNGWQWPGDIYSNRSRIEKRPCLTVNVTAQHCNQIINNIRQNRPQCRVLASDAEASKKTAEILGGLLRSIQASSHADVAHDTAAEHAIYGGEGYWRVLTEFESPRSFDQVIVIQPIENPQLVYLDPFCGMDRLKAQWGFVFEDITKEECKRLYGIDAASWQIDAAGGWVSEDTVRIADYFYCANVPDTLYMLPDGSSVLESEVRAQAGELAEAALVQVKAAAEQLKAIQGGTTTRPTTRPQWKYCKLIGGHDKPVDEQDWAGNYLPIIAVVGKEVNVNGKIVRKGVVRDLKDPARMVNYSYSGAIETVALQNKIPYIAAAEAIEGYEDHWRTANQSTASYLPFNAFDENGNAIPRPERQQPAVMPTAQVNMLELSVEQMRAASGQQNANFGIKSEAASGVGIQRLKVQGETATFHFPDNLARALHDEAVIIIDLIPKVMDTKRIVQILGIDGKEEHAVLDPEFEGSYGELTGQDVDQIFNPNIGRYGVVIDTGPSYQTQRQEAAAALTELATRNPQLMQVAGDIVMRAYDFPFSEQLAERLKKTLPAELQDDEQQQLPPEVQAKMAQMQQATQQLAAALEACHKELETLKVGERDKFNKNLIDAYDAETKRITALGGVMTPDSVMALVQQVVQQALTTPSPAQGMAQPEPEMPPMPPPQVPMQPQPNPPTEAGFSLGAPPEQPAITPPAMAATGAHPGLGEPPPGI